MIYFDNNATTQIAPEVFEAMRPFLESSFGNPSSAHVVGREAKDAVAAARTAVADLLGADESEIVFTASGSESDNWAIVGALESQPEKKHVVTTRVEHEAVRNLCEKLERSGHEISWLDVDESGALDLDQLRESVRRDTAVVSVMRANNETGILFPVEDIAAIVKERSGAVMHVDAVNAAGKVPIRLQDSKIDLLSISAHKFHGPKGIGALYIRSGVQMPSFVIGGGQESGRRAGTEAVHQIVGMGAAARLASDLSPMDRVRQLRDKLETALLGEFSYASVNGSSESNRRLPNTSNISFQNINGEMILALLDEAGICVSTGSACNSADHSPSAVLQAMNVPYSKAMGSIRFSLGRFNTEEEVDFVIGELKSVVEILKELSK